jgi:YidC/Oxa1 family membrane protein insertase
LFKSLGNLFAPIHDLWLAWIEQPLSHFLLFLHQHLDAIPVIHSIGSYGVAIIILTILIRLALAPLQQFQLVTQRKTMVEQRKLAPQVADLRKKYKKDPQKLNTEMMALYREHGVNPLGGMVGCLPLIVQIPILTALYYVFQGFAHTPGLAKQPFLFIPNLNDIPNQQLLIHGVPIPAPVYLVFPLLAALTTLIQSRMLQMPPPPNPTEQEIQTQSMQRTMVWLSPLMIGYFALNVPAGLGLYWFIGNCVSIIQQSFVVGWGNVLPARFRRPAIGGASGAGNGPPPKKLPPGGPKSGSGSGPGNGPKNGPGNGPRPKKPRR